MYLIERDTNGDIKVSVRRQACVGQSAILPLAGSRDSVLLQWTVVGVAWRDHGLFNIYDIVAGGPPIIRNVTEGSALSYLANLAKIYL